MSASVSQGRQHEGTGTCCREQGGLLMPVCGARVGPGHPAGLPAPWEASWAYSDARKPGAAPALPPPCPRPCPSPSLGPALLWHGRGSAPAPSETSPRPPAETGVAPEAGGLPRRRSPCPALLLAAVARWGCRGPRGTVPGCNSAYCICHRVPLEHGSVTCLYTT